SALFPYTTLFRSGRRANGQRGVGRFTHGRRRARRSPSMLTVSATDGQRPAAVDPIEDATLAVIEVRPPSSKGATLGCRCAHRTRRIHALQLSLRRIRPD